jgi:hypothetical protein
MSTQFLPEWALANAYPDSTQNKIRPDSALRQYGYPKDYSPTAEELNWQLNNIYEHINELRLIAQTASQLPVGTILTVKGRADNPNTYLGYGTWVAVQGRFLVGAGNSTDAEGNSVTYTAGATGGTHKTMLSTSQIPDHTHTYKDTYMFEQGAAMGSNVPTEFKEGAAGLNNGFGQGAFNFDNDTLVFRQGTTNASPSVQVAVNTTPAHLVVYMWERTA